LSRLRFALALAALVALSTALIACGEESGNSDENPKAVAEKATLSGIESADVELTLEIKASGKEGGDLEASVTGPFQGEGGGANPQLDMDVEVSGKIDGDDVDFDGGLVLLPNSAYVNYEGTEYEVDPTTFSFVESALNQAQQQGNGEGNSAGATACQEAAADVDLASFIGNLENEGSVDVGGTATTKLSGDLDLSGAIDSLTELTEDPACSAQLGATGAVPSPAELAEAEGELGKSLKTAHLELYVGDDDIVRRIVAELAIEPKDKGDGPSRVDVNFDLTLNGVNEEQEISTPETAKPLTDLFLKLGINPLELAGALQGGEGLGGVLEGLGDAAAGGEASSPSGDGGRQAYLKCIGEVTTAAGLQKCTALLN